MREHIGFRTFVPGEPAETARAVAVRGEVDMVTAPALTRKVTEELSHGGPTLVLDMSEVTFFGVSGLKSLLDANRFADVNGKALVLAACSPAVTRMLDPTGMRTRFGRSGTKGATGVHDVPQRTR